MSWFICPYCGEDNTHPFPHCGESSGHNVELTDEQHDDWYAGYLELEDVMYEVTE